MDWQQIVAMSIVTLTVGLFVWARLKKKRPTQTVCGSGCGCSGTTANGPKISVTYRARRGERPQIITRIS